MNNILKDKPKINLVIDAIMLIVLMAMAGIGFLIKVVLLPGEKRNIIYGSGIDLTFAGMTRHQWGTVHLYISLVFIFLLLLHLILHWKMITCIFRQMLRSKGARVTIAVFILLVSLLLSLTPFFIKPEIVPYTKKHLNAVETQVSGIPEPVTDEPHALTETIVSSPSEDVRESHSGGHRNHATEELEIFGYMTLQEVADRHGIPVSELAESISVPVSQYGETLGRLKRRYGFDLEKLRETVLNITGE